jgi:hypothetical protein
MVVCFFSAPGRGIFSDLEMIFLVLLARKSFREGTYPALFSGVSDLEQKCFFPGLEVFRTKKIDRVLFPA